jgi:hypothetical protein
MPNQDISPAIAVILANQRKTRPDPFPRPIYAKAEKSAQKMTETYGRPPFEARKNILGAFPAPANPSVRTHISQMFREMRGVIQTKSSRAGIQVAGGSRPGRCQEAGIDDLRTMSMGCSTISNTISHTEGRTLIPALWIAITNGDEAAVPSSKSRPGWFEGTRRPMTKVPRI